MQEALPPLPPVGFAGAASRFEQIDTEGYLVGRGARFRAKPSALDFADAGDMRSWIAVMAGGVRWRFLFLKDTWRRRRKMTGGPFVCQSLLPWRKAYQAASRPGMDANCLLTVALQFSGIPLRAPRRSGIADS